MYLFDIVEGPMRNSNAFALLGLLSIKPMTGYEMKKKVEQALSHFWKTSYGQIYPTLSKFVDDGLVTVEKVNTDKGPSSKVYTITVLGEQHLIEWLRVDVEDFNAKDEALLKFYFSDLLSIEEVIEKLERALDYNLGVKTDYENAIVEMKKTSKPSRQQLNVYLATQKGVCLNEARITWAKQCIDTLNWYKGLEE